MKNNYRKSKEYIIFRNTLWRKDLTIKEFSKKIGMSRQNIYLAFQNNTKATIEKILTEVLSL
ncbi:Uncharacterised protein [Sebaldella termitidis]|jgi:DNA-binding phage protein|uniref:HTH cro/C1-type domain-containing protein n=1 Tax=Sebaldella termitidis (strain ATCC 33386 / NCTC 11300) TaxID=526218 RepID=D1AH80_SEBTE|nr:hypothetical protein [Sebaldella termitidis]ACZ08114.1 hypothetical protein Sterm_1247 [Sebaldella termitidis ATCC 33386]SUI23416.1 Uncharacterised protein [Sebaldella termitidis]